MNDTMSCRIERLDNEQDCVVLRVSGRIQAAHADMIRDLLEQEKGRVVIDLKEVVLVAREAVEFLALSEASGTELRNCSFYISEWVAREKDRIGKESSAPEEGASDDVE